MDLSFIILWFSKTDLRTKVFYPITPSCSYTIRLNSENGPTVSVVSVGQKVFHVWECGGNFEIMKIISKPLQLKSM